MSNRNSKWDLFPIFLPTVLLVNVAIIPNIVIYPATTILVLLLINSFYFGSWSVLYDLILKPVDLKETSTHKACRRLNELLEGE